MCVTFYNLQSAFLFFISMVAYNSSDTVRAIITPAYGWENWSPEVLVKTPLVTTWIRLDKKWKCVGPHWLDSWSLIVTRHAGAHSVLCMVSPLFNSFHFLSLLFPSPFASWLSLSVPFSVLQTSSSEHLRHFHHNWNIARHNSYCLNTWKDGASPLPSLDFWMTQRRTLCPMLSTRKISELTLVI